MTSRTPLSYLGIDSKRQPPLITTNRDPLSTDYISYVLGTLWINKSSATVFILTEIAGNAATWVQLGVGGSSGIQKITLPGGVEITPTSGNITFSEATPIQITSPGSSEANFALTPPTTVVFSWQEVTSATPISLGVGYIANGGSKVDFTLPTSADVGDVFAITAKNANGFKINQGAGQSIRIGNAQTTVGTGGSVSSNEIGDGVQLICITANTAFQALPGVQGNLEVM